MQLARSAPRAPVLHSRGLQRHSLLLRATPAPSPTTPLPTPPPPHTHTQLCFVVCDALKSKSDSMVALAEDHLNDIASNLAAVGAAVLTQLVADGWWIDPVM